MKVYIHTFGCKVNFYESAAMARLLRQSGYATVSGACGADVVIVNSCTVTAGGDRKVAQYLRRIRREHPGVVLVLSGCMPQAYPERAASFPDVDIVTGTGSRADIVALIEGFFADRTRKIDIRTDGKTAFEPLTADEVEGHTRAFLKIEDGCDRFCSYCIIPRARGPVRSMPLEEVRRNAARFAQAGYREIVLSGINLSFYGRGTEYDLADAVAAVGAMDGIVRLRLGSLEPDLLSDGLLRRLATQTKLCPHFHLSLQSGCNATLAQMNRHYGTDDYTAVAEKLRALFDRPTFTTDVMVGFPGETEEDFLESLDYVRAFGFLKCHVFPYSVRPGTASAELGGQLPVKEKERRAALMRAAADDARGRVLSAFIGQQARVILEQPRGAGYTGYTDRYLPALVSGHGLRGGDVVQGTIVAIKGGRCIVERGEEHAGKPV